MWWGKQRCKCSRQWFDTLPPSYNQAAGHLRDKPFNAALKILMSQVQEATTTPKRKPAEWNLVPHQIRGLFDCQRITHILVPVGERPVLPWIGHVPALPSVSTRKAIRHLEKIGYRVVPGRGRGSHIWLECEGRRPVNLPANRERLTPGLIKHIAGALGLRVADLRIWFRPSDGRHGEDGSNETEAQEAGSRPWALGTTSPHVGIPDDPQDLAERSLTALLFR
jgi:predicted RNA binding protein YcfA (HicA-like mRNA interferase family)